MLELAMVAVLVAAPAESPFRARVETLRTMLNDGKMAEAKKAGPKLLEELVTAARAKDHTTETVVLLGRVQLYGGDATAAALTFDEALTAAPDDGDANFYRGLASQQLHSLDDAVKFLTRATVLQPGQARGWAELGSTLAGQDQPTLALPALQKAIALDPKDASSLALAGNLLTENGRGAEGIVLLEKASALDPLNLDTLYNAGQYYQLEGKPKLALERFAAVAKAAPEDWHARAKLVQLNQALGQLPERDQARAEVLALFRAHKIDAKFTDFCREQFTVGEDRVLAYESFELTGDRAVRYSFRVAAAKSGTIKRVISLGSYAFTTEYMRSSGQLKEGERAWHLDGYAPDNSHATYGFFDGEASYEITRAKVVDVLEGRAKPMSSTSVKKNAP